MSGFGLCAKAAFVWAMGVGLVATRGKRQVNPIFERVGGIVMMAG